jgi:hypothetical protein
MLIHYNNNKTKQLAPGELVPTDSTNYGTFERVQGKADETFAPGLTWAERNNTVSSTTWPSTRAGHAAVWDVDAGGMWVYGGYNTYFPYISTDGAGSGAGVKVRT